MKELFRAAEPKNIWSADPGAVFAQKGAPAEFTSFVEKKQLLRPDLWKRFVGQFRMDDANPNNGWRGEYWGKMMRGACFTYRCNGDPELYACLRDTVLDMLSVQEENGRISAYGEYHEFDAWDLWERKYVLLGMQYFMEICDDEQLNARLTDSMCRQLDYIIAHVGPEEGKKKITDCTRHWRGLNSCSILEPVVRLYNRTGKQEYLDYAKYIVEIGGTDVADLFELAYRDQFKPYQYPVTKAYEMTSCFEGLLEYYQVTGIEKYRTALIRFADAILDTDFTVIGSSGCTHELFDHSTWRQTNTTNGPIAQETCVTVTLMKFFYRMTLLTGDMKYAAAFERSLWNAYYGAINTEDQIEPLILQQHPDWVCEPLPFDSYSPLTAGRRGKGIGGLQVMSDMHYYGCCACIGSMGNGLAPQMQWMRAENGFVMALYLPGTIDTVTPAGNALRVTVDTAYPVENEVRVTLEPACAERFTLTLRRFDFGEECPATLNGEPLSAEGDRYVIDRVWQKGDTVVLKADLRTRALCPVGYGTDILMNTQVHGLHYYIPFFDVQDPIATRHIALQRGPLMLAQDARLGCSVDAPVEPLINADGTVDVQLPAADTAPYPHLLEVRVPLANGSTMTVTDYASAGKLFSDDCRMAVWMLTEQPHAKRI